MENKETALEAIVSSAYRSLTWPYTLKTAERRMKEYESNHTEKSDYHASGVYLLAKIVTGWAGLYIPITLFDLGSEFVFVPFTTNIASWVYERHKAQQQISKLKLGEEE